MNRYLILNLQAHLMSFGGETIDAYGVTRFFPATSMITGLLANALGYSRTEGPKLQALQDRIHFAARIDREPPNQAPMTDYQTAKLGHDDQGWTTRGRPQGRDGDKNTYASPHPKFQEYLPDTRVTVALRLSQPGQAPTIEDLAQALRKPERPLFIGRKSCPPSAPICAGTAQAETALEALLDWPMAAAEGLGFRSRNIRLMWPPEEEGTLPQNVAVIWQYPITDQRNHNFTIHGGNRTVREGNAPRESFPPANPPPNADQENQNKRRTQEPQKAGATS